MRYQRYQTYKDSGVAWLGQVPAHWEVRKLANIAHLGSGTTPKSDQFEYYENGTIPWVNTGDLNDGIVSCSAKYITPYALNNISTLKLYSSGSVIIAMYGATIGKLGICEFQTTVNQACCVITPYDILNNKFVFYALLNMRQYLLSLAVGGTQPNISQDVVSTLRLPLPPLAEQQAIAAFLDRECAQIDTLVAAQQRLIALLKEKRQALIAHTVTQGLDPAAPRKDSGVAWLGQVPAHWQMKKIKSLTKFSSGGTPSRDEPSFWNGDIPWVSAKDMKSKFISNSEEFITHEGLQNTSGSIIPEGAVLMVVRSGILKHTIPVAINTVPVTINQDLKCIVLTNECTNIFFYYWITGNNSLLLHLWSKQGATVESIEHEYMVNTLIPLPPLAEQQAIAAFLDRECARIDTLIGKAEQAITLLHERRSALIAAAVTGQIRVANEE